jgi:hypothetical protein
MGGSCGEQIEVYPPQGALDTTALILDRSKQSAAQRGSNRISAVDTANVCGGTLNVESRRLSLK